jgi:uncharacterized protein (TIGR03435 family)
MKTAVFEAVSVKSCNATGGPAWIYSDRYQIEVKAEGTPREEVMLGPMLQTLLEDRFNLKIHRETREVPAYELTVAKGGLKMQPVPPGRCTLLDISPEAAAGRSAGCELLPPEYRPNEGTEQDY